MRLINALKNKDIEDSVRIMEGIIFTALDALRQALT